MEKKKIADMEESKSPSRPPHEPGRPALVLRPFPVGGCEHMVVDGASGWCE